MGIEYLIVILIGLMVIGALIAVEARDLLGSVIALGAVGFALGVIDLLLGAPDLAITQVVVEVFALVLLIRAVRTREDTTTQQPRDTLRTGIVLLAGGVLLAAVFAALVSAGHMPAFGEPILAGGAVVPPGVSADYLANAAKETGAANTVMAILLDYRAYDTLGEATIVFAAVLGTYALLRRIGRKPGRPGSAEPEEAAR
jgi:multisubunit Na+/H+ antiporter MnhB subunit